MRLGIGDGTFGPSIAYASARGSFGIGLADLSLDGRLDIAVASHLDSTLTVFVGAGDGTVGAAAPYPMGSRRLPYVDAVLAADFDRDGRLDIATPGNGGAAVRRGRGDGTLFGLQSVDPDPHGLTTQSGAVGDFNGDGWPDLAVSVACTGEDCYEGRTPWPSISTGRANLPHPASSRT